MSDVMVDFVAEGRVFAQPDGLNGKDRASFRAKTPLCFAAFKLPKRNFGILAIEVARQ
jgi:hypothetical protein